MDSWRKLSTPDSTQDGCKIYDVDYAELFQNHDGDLDQMMNDLAYVEVATHNLTIKCDHWEYDRSFWQKTIIMEWDLVCSRSQLKKLSQQVAFFGLVCGALITGLLSDRYKINCVLRHSYMVNNCGHNLDRTLLSPFGKGIRKKRLLCMYCLHFIDT